MTVRRPWYPFNVVDYNADTGRLTTIQHGAYILLMNEYWLSGGLPDDDEQLAVITKLPPDAWLMLKSKIEQFFLPGWKHKRIDKELRIAKSFKKHAEKAAAKRWGNKGNRDNARSMPEDMPGECSEQYTRATPTKRHIRKIPKEILQMCLSEETAIAVLEHRKAKQAPLTARAAELLVKAFEDYGDPEKAANEMISHNWRGFNPTWKGLPATNGHKHPNGASGIFVKRDTPQWEAWQVWWMKTKGKSMPGGDGWFCPSEYPPEMQQ